MARVQGQRVSIDKDTGKFTIPSEGYLSLIEIELNDFAPVLEIEGELPVSAETFPKGAPSNYVKVGDTIYEKVDSIVKSQRDQTK